MAVALAAGVSNGDIQNFVMGSNPYYRRLVFRYRSYSLPDARREVGTRSSMWFLYSTQPICIDIYPVAD